ncbi:MAG TPA: hypothetical protein VFP54_07860 [Acidimicrobiales bacterium]|nr:hypothetical protein [Acidimicrobiales bacterium]
MDVGKLAKDAGYVFLGIAIIEFQRAQVRRREMETQLSSAVGQLEGFLPAPVRDLLGKR